jgi:acyl-CoA synthetase (AMP-forming)/AMP-acid ligase II
MRLFKEIELVAKKKAEKSCLVSPKGRMSYQDLLIDVAEREKEIATYKPRKGTSLLFKSSDAISVIGTLLACSKMNLAFVPLDAGITDEELTKIKALFKGDKLIFDGDSTIYEESDPEDNLNDTAMVQFSSGSTGTPKGILIGHEAAYLRAANLADSLELTSDDKTLCSVPITHSHGIDCLVLTTLLAGAELHVMPPAFAAPNTVLSYIEKNKITFYSSLPAFYFAANQLSSKFKYDLSSLRLAFCGSAALDIKTAQNFFERYSMPIRQGYGLAEVCVITLNVSNSHKHSSIGRPIKGIEWQLEDDGELVVRSKAMYQGYLGSDQEVTELRTGDIVEVDNEGDFYIAGRKSTFINVNGLKVSPLEIELAVKESGWKGECKVLGAIDEKMGQKICLHLELGADQLTEDEMKSNVEQLHEMLALKISSYKLPKDIFVYTQLPKGPLGKVLATRISEDHAIFNRSF